MEKFEVQSIVKDVRISIGNCLKTDLFLGNLSESSGVYKVHYSRKAPMWSKVRSLVYASFADKFKSITELSKLFKLPSLLPIDRKALVKYRAATVMLSTAFCNGWHKDKTCGIFKMRPMEDDVYTEFCKHYTPRKYDIKWARGAGESFSVNFKGDSGFNSLAKAVMNKSIPKCLRIAGEKLVNRVCFIGDFEDWAAYKQIIEMLFPEYRTVYYTSTGMWLNPDTNEKVIIFTPFRPGILDNLKEAGFITITFFSELARLCDFTIPYTNTELVLMNLHRIRRVLVHGRTVKEVDSFYNREEVKE